MIIARDVIFDENCQEKALQALKVSKGGLPLTLFEKEHGMQLIPAKSVEADAIQVRKEELYNDAYIELDEAEVYEALSGDPALPPPGGGRAGSPLSAS